MIITCKDCSTSYNLDENVLKPSGSRVRCSKCGSIFTAFPPPTVQAGMPPEEAFVQAASPTLTGRIRSDEDASRPSFGKNSFYQAADDKAASSAEAGQILKDDSAGARLNSETEDPEAYEAISPDMVREIEDEDLESTDNEERGLTADEIRAPLATTPVDDAGLDSDLDFGAEDFDLGDLEEELAAKEELSPEDLQLTAEDLDLVMDFKPEAILSETETKDQTESPASPQASSPPETAVKSPETPELEVDLDADADEPVKLEPEDLELGFTLDSDRESNAGSTEAGAEELDQELDFETEEPAPSPPAKDVFDDLDADLDFETEDSTAAASPEKSEALSLDLADEPARQAADEVADDLNLGLELDKDEQEPATRDDSDLDLDLALDTEPTEEKDELDLDFALNEESTAAIDEPAADKADLDLGLELQDESEKTDSLDDLDLDLSLAEEPAEKVEPEDLDLNLDFNEIPDAASAESDSAELNIEPELNLDLAEEVESANKIEASDDFDLSDLEQMLESGGKSVTKGPAVKVKRPEDEDAEGAVPESQPAAGMNLGHDAGEFDISEIEQILDEEEEVDKKSAEIKADEELELDLGDEFAQAAKTADSKKDSSADLDLSEFEYLAEQGEKSPADDHFDTGDMELEFQIDEQPSGAAVPVSATAPAAAAAAAATASLAEPEADLVDEALLPRPEAPAMPMKKRGISKVLIFLLILVILLGGGYCAYILIDGMGIRIPFISDYLKPQVNDPGSANIQANIDINSKFVDNATGGRLFVITGKVKNGYPQARTFVQLTGKLFTQGKKLAITETVYCGNVISDEDLANTDVASIKKQLSDRFGDKKADMQVNPGQTLPFMVVFSDLPKEQLEEFTIEPVMSTAVGK